MNPTTKAAVIEALDGLLKAHAIPSSVCAERPAYEAAHAALALLSSEPEPTPEPGERDRAVLSEMIDSYALAFHAAIVRPESHDKMKAKAESIMNAILARSSLPPAPTKGTE
jgi:hypothetical protein